MQTSYVYSKPLQKTVINALLKLFCRKNFEIFRLIRQISTMWTGSVNQMLNISLVRSVERLSDNWEKKTFIIALTSFPHLLENVTDCRWTHHRRLFDAYFQFSSKYKINWGTGFTFHIHGITPDVWCLPSRDIFNELMAKLLNKYGACKRRILL